MTPEKHLAAILVAWGETDGYTISPAMDEALSVAERDFDGVESEEFNLNEVSFLREVTPMDTVTRSTSDNS